MSADEGQSLRAKAVKIKPKSPLKDCDRLTCQFSMVHERCGDQPKSASFGFSKDLETRGIQPFVRELEVGEEWQELDFGWLTGKAGYLVVQSRAGVGLRVNPTYEERNLWDRQVVELAVEPGEAMFIVRTGRGFAGEVAPDTSLVARVSEGTTRLLVTVFPR